MVKQLTRDDLFNIFWYCTDINAILDSKCYTTIIKKGVYIEKTGGIISFITKSDHTIHLPYRTIPGSLLKKYPRFQWTYNTNCYNHSRAADLFKNQKDYTLNSFYTSSLELSVDHPHIPKEFIDQAWSELQLYKEKTRSQSSILSDVIDIIPKEGKKEDIPEEPKPDNLTLDVLPSFNNKEVISEVYSEGENLIQYQSNLDILEPPDNFSDRIQLPLNNSLNNIGVPLNQISVMANKTPIECVAEDQANLRAEDRPGFLGVGTNRAYVHKWLQTHAIYGKLMFKNINFDILNGRFDDINSYIAMEIVTRARVRLAKIPDADNIAMVILMAELHGGFLPDDMYMTTEDARKEYTEILNALKNPEDNGLVMIINQEGFTVSDELADMHKDFVDKVLNNARKKWGPTSLMTHSILAYAKRGTVNGRLIQKVQKSISQELQLEINFEVGVMKTFHTVYGHYVTELNAKMLFTYWSTILPKHALRLTLLVQQTIGSGLTAYYTVMKAVVTYQDFEWDKISKLYAAEWADFSTASKAIGANVYYGFKADLQAVRSTKYKNISWVCKELLIRLNGEAALKAYDGWLEKPMYPDVISGIIDSYVKKYNESKAVIPKVTEAEKVKVTEVIQGLIKNYEALQITN